MFIYFFIDIIFIGGYQYDWRTKKIQNSKKESYEKRIQGYNKLEIADAVAVGIFTSFLLATANHYGNYEWSGNFATLLMMFGEGIIDGLYIKKLINDIVAKTNLKSKLEDLTDELEQSGEMALWVLN